MQRDYYTKRFPVTSPVVGGYGTTAQNKINQQVADALGDLRGFKTGLEVTLKNNNNLYVNGGAIEIAGQIYLVSSQQTLALGIVSVNTRYYVYIGATSLTISTTAPYYDQAQAGYYKTGDATLRCIGGFYRE